MFHAKCFRLLLLQLLIVAGFLLSGSLRADSGEQAGQEQPTEQQPQQNENAEVVEPSTKATPSAPKLKHYKDAAQPIDTSSAVINMVVGLVGIVILILAISWGMRRFTQLPGQSSSLMKITATLAVGTRERIALVDVGNKRLLIGVTPNNINVLHVFDEGELPANVERSDFAAKLQSILTKGNSA